MEKRVMCFVIAGFLAVIAAICLIAVGIHSYHVEEVKIPIKTEIERGIEVQGLRNDFCYMQPVWFGGAGAGGLGAPEVICYNASQFIQLVPEGERIYVALVPKTTEIWQNRGKVVRIEKTYWAFIENRAGILIYKDIYQYQKHNEPWIVKSYTPHAVTFTWNNFKRPNLPWISGLLLMVLAITLFLCRTPPKE